MESESYVFLCFPFCDSNPQSAVEEPKLKISWSAHFFFFIYSYLYVHVAYAWAATGIVCYFVYINYKAVLRLRWQWFRSEEYQNAIYARSLMMTHVGPYAPSYLSVSYPLTDLHPSVSSSFLIAA